MPAPSPWLAILAQFSLGEHAVRAMAALDGQFFEGRILHILPSQQPHRPREAAGKEGEKGFKAGKEAKLKETASSSHNWNALFMRADAVGDAVASRYGVDKCASCGAPPSPRRPTAHWTRTQRAGAMVVPPTCCIDSTASLPASRHRAILPR